jgi:hypothetical protein
MIANAPVTVEFLGMPRLRAGCGSTAVRGATLSEVLAALEASFVQLRGLRRRDGGPSSHYLVSLDGRRFLSDPHERLEPGSRLLLLSADAGG